MRSSICYWGLSAECQNTIFVIFCNCNIGAIVPLKLTAGYYLFVSFSSICRNHQFARILGCNSSHQGRYLLDISLVIWIDVSNDLGYIQDPLCHTLKSYQQGDSHEGCNESLILILGVCTGYPFSYFSNKHLSSWLLLLDFPCLACGCQKFVVWLI